MKVTGVTEWPTPRNKCTVQSFLGTGLCSHGPHRARSSSARHARTVPIHNAVNAHARTHARMGSRENEKKLGRWQIAGGGGAVRARARLVRFKGGPGEGVAGVRGAAGASLLSIGALIIS